MKALLTLVVAFSASALAKVSLSKGVPSEFLWGVAGASYQVEGGWNEGGRQASIWDVFSHEPGKVANNENGDVADDTYHRYAEDVRIAYDMGVKSYRFSVSWSRVLSMASGGGPYDQVPNAEGLAYYNRLIDEILKYDMVPFLTIYHWDLPMSVYDATGGGWINERIVPYFEVFADLLFRTYGDRVKFWLTFNEPLTFCIQGYLTGGHAPGRCSDRTHCASGNSSTEPYLCAHNVLLSHAVACQLYHDKYQFWQNGVIGATLSGDWGEPMTSSYMDKEAAERYMQWQIGWFADPIYYGDYPTEMRRLVGERLPRFNAQQSEMLKRSVDFYGMNQYTGSWVAHKYISTDTPDWGTDQQSDVRGDNYNGTLIGPQAASGWLHKVPYSIRRVLNWIADRYGNPQIYMTENGCDCPHETEDPLPGVLEDWFRVDYYSGYLSNVMKAIREDGVNVRSYHAWSLNDNFEWADGYAYRFGLHYVDYNNNLTRYEKQSSRWYSNYIKNNP